MKEKITVDELMQCAKDISEVANAHYDAATYLFNAIDALKQLSEMYDLKRIAISLACAVSSALPGDPRYTSSNRKWALCTLSQSMFYEQRFQIGGMMSSLHSGLINLLVDDVRKELGGDCYSGVEHGAV